MLIVADIGNTKTHIGLFDGRKVVQAYTVNTRTMSSVKLRLWKSKNIGGVVYASVRPSAERKFESVIRKHLGTLPIKKLGRDIKPPISLKVDNPKTVGMDRLANAIAAYERVKDACVVVDMGTAITFDVVSKKGEFVGGVIASGMGISAKALNDYCELLPLIKPDKPTKTIGKNTIDNIKSGVFWSVVGLIECVIKNIRRELKCKPYIIATGGDANLLKNLGLFDEVIPHLTLEGIATAYYTTENKAATHDHK